MPNKTAPKMDAVAVSPLISKNADFLRQFNANARARHAQRRMLESANDEQLLCFVEVCFNILKGRLPLTKRHMCKLEKLKHFLRRLARVRCARSARQTLLQQNGAGLPAIATVLSSILMPMLIEKIMENK